jgi:hypothetical protein
VCGIADHRLIEIADLDQNTAVCVGEGPKIADVAIAANTHFRTFRQFAAATVLQPFVKLDGTAADVGVRGPRHLKIPGLCQNPLPIVGFCHKAKSRRSTWLFISERK